MSEPVSRYTVTMRDLRARCPLLASIEVVEPEGLIGKNHVGEIVVRAKGRITPRLIEQFRNTYQTAVSAGLIKQPIPIEEEPHA